MSSASFCKELQREEGGIQGLDSMQSYPPPRYHQSTALELGEARHDSCDAPPAVVRRELPAPGRRKPLPVPPPRSDENRKHREDVSGDLAGLSMRDKPLEAPTISIAAPLIAIDAPSAGVDEALLPAISITSIEEELPLPRANVVARTSATVLLVCAACGLDIQGKVLKAMSKRFHPSCFRCKACDTCLEQLAFHEKDGEAYCHVDYHELFTIRCDHCKTPIVDEQYVTITDEALGTKTYHELHFFCASCGDPFIDAKTRGEPNPFVIHKGHAYCQACDIRWRAPKCAGCKEPIAGDILKALKTTWHAQCFVCEGCHRLFSDATFFVRGEKPFCRDCERQFLSRQM